MSIGGNSHEPMRDPVAGAMTRLTRALQLLRYEQLPFAPRLVAKSNDCFMPLSVSRPGGGHRPLPLHTCHCISGIVWLQWVATPIPGEKEAVSGVAPVGSRMPYARSTSYRRHSGKRRLPYPTAASWQSASKMPRIYCSMRMPSSMPESSCADFGRSSQ